MLFNAAFPKGLEREGERGREKDRSHVASFSSFPKGGNDWLSSLRLVWEGRERESGGREGGRRRRGGKEGGKEMSEREYGERIRAEGRVEHGEPRREL